MMKLTPYADKLSDITVAMGQVLFASAFVDPIISGVYNWTLIISGIAFAIATWLLGLELVRNKNYE